MNIPEGWKLNRQKESISREFNFETFSQSVDFVNQVAVLAESVGHHPDISISYTKVSLSLSTHDAGGVTEKDLNLALKINKLPL